MDEVAQSVVDVVVASPEVHRGAEVDSVPEGAVDPDSLAVAVVASRGVHREDVVDSAEEEVRDSGTSQSGVLGVLITCLFQVLCVQKSQLP